MVKLSDLSPSTETVRAANADIPVQAPRLGEILALINKHRKIGLALSLPSDQRVVGIVEAIFDCGKEAINDAVDVAVGWEKGNAEKAPLNGLEEVAIVTKSVELLLTGDDAEKLLAEVKKAFARLGPIAGI